LPGFAQIIPANKAARNQAPLAPLLTWSSHLVHRSARQKCCKTTVRIARFG